VFNVDESAGSNVPSVSTPVSRRPFPVPPLQYEITISVYYFVLCTAERLLCPIVCPDVLCQHGLVCRPGASITHMEASYDRMW